MGNQNETPAKTQGEKMPRWLKGIVASLLLMCMAGLAVQCDAPTCNRFWVDGVYSAHERLACEGRVLTVSRAVQVDGGTIHVDDDDQIVLPIQSAHSPCGNARDNNGNFNPMVLLATSNVWDTEPLNNTDGPSFVSVPDAVGGAGRRMSPKWSIEEDPKRWDMCGGVHNWPAAYASKGDEVSFNLADFPNPWTFGLVRHDVDQRLLARNSTWTFSGFYHQRATQSTPWGASRCHTSGLYVSLLPALVQVTDLQGVTQEVWHSRSTVVWNNGAVIPGNNLGPHIIWNSIYHDAFVGIDSMATSDGQGNNGENRYRMFELIEFEEPYTEGDYLLDCFPEPAWNHYALHSNAADEGCANGPCNPEGFFTQQVDDDFNW